MSSLGIAASPQIHRDETVQISLPLAFAGGAYATKVIPDLALGLPVMALLIVLLRCEIRADEERL
jgi:hypothetical protein